MTSSKPYLIRAIYEWIVDNSLTPYIAVDTETPGTIVPPEYIKDGRIILDISPTAINNLIIGNESLEFKARFNGTSHSLWIPITAITIIYAQENNQGMAFPPDEYEADFIEEDGQQTISMPKKSRAHLKLVTNASDIDDDINA